MSCARLVFGNDTSAGWQVTLCDPIWHVSSRSGEAIVANCYTPFTLPSNQRRTRDAEGVEFEAPRVETPNESRGWGMGREYPPPQLTKGSGEAL